MIYFIREPESNLVKIGHATNPEKRFHQIQTGSPRCLERVALMEGGSRKERQLHLRFGGHRLRGEWFWMSQRIDSYVKRYGTPWFAKQVSIQKRALREEAAAQKAERRAKAAAKPPDPFRMLPPEQRKNSFDLKALRAKLG